MLDLMENHLREACHLTSAAWAAVADCDKGKWFVEAAYHLPKPRHAALESYLSLDVAEAWIDGSLHGKTAPPVSLPADGKLGSGYLYVFGMETTSEIVLVCAAELDARSRRIWRLFAGLVDGGSDTGVVPSVIESLCHPSDACSLELKIVGCVANFRLKTRIKRIVSAAAGRQHYGHKRDDQPPRAGH